MTNLSKATREKLEKETYVSTLKIREKYVSKIDGTVKYLFELPDGNCIESVVMRYHLIKLFLHKKTSASV